MAVGVKRKSDTHPGNVESGAEETTDSDSFSPEKKGKLDNPTKRKRKKKEEEKNDKVKSPPSTKRQRRKRSNVESDVPQEPISTKCVVHKKAKESKMAETQMTAVASSDATGQDQHRAADEQNVEIEASTGDNEVELTSTTECSTNTNIAKMSNIEKTSKMGIISKRRLSAQSALVSKFAVDNYIPLGAAHR